MLSDTVNFYLACAAAVLVVSRWIWPYLTVQKGSLSAPPGPPGLPIVGNVRDVAGADSHIAYSRLAKQYGPIMQFEVLGQSVVVISDAKIALDLLEKRGAVYSGRPKFHMALESGYSWSLALIGPTDAWRTRRQLVHQHFHAKSIPQRHMLLRRAALRLAQNLLLSQSGFRERIQH